MELSCMSVDELKNARRKIDRELKTRQQNFKLTVEMISDREFVVRAENILQKTPEIYEEFEAYGYGHIVSYLPRTSKIGFRYEDTRDAENCRYHIYQFIRDLKKTCY